jgi:uncharacterized metal-binding protein YceD (DUF177 family)
MSRPVVPYSAPFDLGSVHDRDAEVVLAPSETERASISEWLGTLAVESLKAKILISRKGDGEYTYAVSFDGDVVQACVVTLEPVRAHLSGEFHRRFRVLPRSSASRHKKPAEEAAYIDISSLDADEPELLRSPVVDLAAPLLEEISLSLDPYPRSPGVSFEPPAEAAGPGDSPFAVLEKLKTAKTRPSRPATAGAGSGAVSSAKKLG